MKQADRKKVGIVTWNGSSNYGTNLQAYALFCKIKLLGFDPYMVTFFNIKEFGIIGLVKKALRKIVRKLSSFFTKETKGLNREKMKRVEEFVQSNFIYSPRILTRRQQNKLVQDTDCFITGSDQIWNPYHIKSYCTLLDFVDDKTPKIAYASSVGVDEIPEQYKRIYKTYLSRFNYLALREKQGAVIVKEITGRKDVRTVIDPTFLLSREDWNTFAEDAIIDDQVIMKETYIFCYFVGDNPEYWEEVYKIQKQTGINKIIVIPLEKSHYEANAYLLETAGPNEFIWLIQNASLICTDSFHATALSINMQKDFIVFLRFKNTDTKSQNSRISELLEHYRLTNRLYKETKIGNYPPIDYTYPTQILENDRLDSLKYLTNALNQK